MLPAPASPAAPSDPLPAPGSRTPECPRCGYDLSGMVESWRETCPLDATCSECGLAFACADVLRPERTAPRWFFEHVLRPSIPRFIKTCIIVSARPGYFWRCVRLEHLIRARRLRMAALFLILLGHFACGAVAAAAVYFDAYLQRYWNWPGYSLPASPPSHVDLLASLWPRLFATFMFPHVDWGILTAPLGFMLLFAALVPLSFLILRQTLRRCRVRPSHMLRGFVWSLPVNIAVFVPAMALTAYTWSFTPLNLAVPILLLWHAWYWFMFTRRYLRLPHAIAVTIAMFTIGVLASVTIMILLDA